MVPSDQGLPVPCAGRSLSARREDRRCQRAGPLRPYPHALGGVLVGVADATRRRGTMTVVFEMARRGEPKTLEFANVDAFYRHLDVLAKENRRDPFRRRQFWWAREAQTSALLAKWNPS